MAALIESKPLTTTREIIDILAHYNTEMKVLPVVIVYHYSVGDKRAYLEFKKV